MGIKFEVGVKRALSWPAEVDGADSKTPESPRGKTPSKESPTKSKEAKSKEPKVCDVIVQSVSS